MEKGEEKTKKRRKIFTLLVALSIIGIITMALVYRASITSKVTGEAIKSNSESKTISEAEAANKLLELLNKKYGGVRFFSSENLGSIYLIIVIKDETRAGFFVTNDGKFYSEATYLEPFDQKDYRKK